MNVHRLLCDSVKEAITIFIIIIFLTVMCRKHKQKEPTVTVLSVNAIGKIVYI